MRHRTSPCVFWHPSLAQTVQVLRCLCPQEWRKLNCSRKSFQPLCPCPWGCPKYRVSVGKGSFWQLPAGSRLMCLMTTGNTSPGAGGPAEPRCSQGVEDGLAQKADTPAPSFYYRWEFICFQRPRNSCKWPEFYLDLEFSNLELLKWVLRGCLRHKLAEWEGEAKQGFYLPLNLLFEATGEETRSLFFKPSIAVRLFCWEREWFFFPYSLLWLRTVHTSKWLPLHNKLEATWKKKKGKAAVSREFKNICSKICLSVYWLLFPIAKELHVHFCFFRSTLCVLLTAGTLAPKYCQIALSNGDFFCLFSFSPLSLSVPLPASPSLLSSLHLFLL